MEKKTALEHTFVHMLPASRTLSVHVSVLQWEGSCKQNLFQSCVAIMWKKRVTLGNDINTVQ